jgi:hypothetical protein
LNKIKIVYFEFLFSQLSSSSNNRKFTMVFLIKQKVLIPCKISINITTMVPVLFIFHIPNFWDVTFVVMPRVNLIVILMTYVCYFYSINFPTIICLPSMLLFILWRDTTSEMWTPVQFPLHCYTVLLLLDPFTFTCITIILLPLDTLNPLFTVN